MKSPTGQYSYRQDVMNIPTSHRVRDVFCTASRRSTMTSRITKRHAVKTNRQTGSMFPTLPDRTDCFCGPVSIVGIQNRDPHHTITSSLPCDVPHTSKMTGTHQEQLLDHLRVLLFFIELNMFLYIMISRHRRQQNPAPAQPASPPPRRRRKPKNPWVMPWIL